MLIYSNINLSWPLIKLITFYPYRFKNIHKFIITNTYPLTEITTYSPINSLEEDVYYYCYNMISSRKLDFEMNNKNKYQKISCLCLNSQRTFNKFVYIPSNLNTNDVIIKFNLSSSNSPYPGIILA